uniref:Kazal-like domain-containing protein n=1 Tax=Timema tahoe TaxID=61484 RepID=A0A7R9IH14_9NEOP|nr:unnamed protein product [Timema tahoe]
MENSRLANMVVVIVLVGLCVARPRSPGKTLTECIPTDIDCEEDMGLVCGIDEFGLLRTFRSQCQMEFSNCADKTYYAFFREGEC